MSDAPKSMELDLESAQELAPIFSNKFFVSVNPTHVRITFGHAFLEGESPRTLANLVMSIQDAQELARLIPALWEQTMAKEAALKAEAKEPNGGE